MPTSPEERDSRGPVPEFTEAELLYLHRYLIEGGEESGDGDWYLYANIVAKLDDWKWPT